MHHKYIILLRVRMILLVFFVPVIFLSPTFFIFPTWSSIHLEHADRRLQKKSPRNFDPHLPPCLSGSVCRVWPLSRARILVASGWLVQACWWIGCDGTRYIFCRMVRDFCIKVSKPTILFLKRIILWTHTQQYRRFGLHLVMMIMTR